jgi:hypothetical protein
MELARAALGIIFCAAALVIAWIEIFWRPACDRSA